MADVRPDGSDWSCKLFATDADFEPALQPKRDLNRVVRMRVQFRSPLALEHPVGCTFPYCNPPLADDWNAYYCARVSTPPSS